MTHITGERRIIKCPLKDASQGSRRYHRTETERLDEAGRSPIPRTAAAEVREGKIGNPHGFLLRKPCGDGTAASSKPWVLSRGREGRERGKKKYSEEKSSILSAGRFPAFGPSTLSVSLSLPCLKLLATRPDVLYPV